MQDTILESQHITVEDACQKIEQEEKITDSDESFKEKLEELQSCQGIFVNTGKSGKTYTAEVSFYFAHGKLFASIDYDGYSGTIDDAEVDWKSLPKSETYCIGFYPKGKFYSVEHDFTVEVDKEKLHIQWGDDCDYVLKRASGATEELKGAESSFEESDTYKAICEKVDSTFSGKDHQVVYEQSSGTLYIYLVISEGSRKEFIANAEELKDSWTKIVDELKTFSETIGKTIELATWDAHNFAEDYCKIMVVDSIKDDEKYYAQDTWAIIADGKVEYDLLGDISVGNSTEKKITQSSVDDEKDTESQSDTPENKSDREIPTEATPQMKEFSSSGEKNALAKAKSYLEIMAFSHDGLVEQLEYEGYSHSEALYGAEYCGADWKEQAVKKASSYLEIMAFSKEKLIEQLRYEGFTDEEANYGVTHAY